MPRKPIAPSPDSVRAQMDAEREDLTSTVKRLERERVELQKHSKNQPAEPDDRLHLESKIQQNANDHRQAAAKLKRCEQQIEHAKKQLERGDEAFDPAD
jgi:chromosome segregation ATPase